MKSKKIYGVSKNLIIMAALVQLAISQIHIGIITKVFASHAGFYLFLFIIFGLVTAFNATSSIRGNKIFLFLGGFLGASGMGSIYLIILLKDIESGKYLTFSDAYLSIIILIITISLYLVGGSLMLINRNSNG